MTQSTVRRAGFVALVLLMLGCGQPLRADLVLSNYTAAHPMKIMCIGDSITDDCEGNGAWRYYLQTLLQNNGYQFNFVGRQQSSPTPPTFTKVNHEGYCGSVIAAPGVYAVHNYNTTDAYLLKIVADALGIQANLPDLVLLLIGTNDVGRGRDPYHVATNDMPQLLDLIFSKAPNANIILAKITSLQNANLPGLSYASYAMNVPIYNAALQTMVNARRAQGQNVFLADMYSVVDYQTMFQGDHVHPNSTGFFMVANEWLARMQAITLRTNQATFRFIGGGDVWKYSDGGTDPGTNWAAPDYDDSGWSNGLARFGYGDPTVATALNFGTDPSNKPLTAYFRHSFQVPWNLAVTNLNFRLARADGAAVWLNGQEIYRTNLPVGMLTSATPANATMTPQSAQIYYQLTKKFSGLPAGTNTLAAEVHLHAPTNAAMEFDLELFGTGSILPPPALALESAGGGLLLSWPLTNSSGFSLYSTTTPWVSGSWTAASLALQTNNGRAFAAPGNDSAATFFRLQRN